MATGVRDFINSKAGQVLAVLSIVICLGLAIHMVKGFFGKSELANAASGRMFIDATDGKAFSHEISIGDKVPVKAPSGGFTGFPAEPCYWTKEGGKKADPTWVLLNQYAGKPEPTYCPDCGRLVTQNNPAPGLGVTAPPTASESKAGAHVEK